MLAAAGYEMACTLYSNVSYAILQVIKYEPLGGPAFIWSLEWSADSSRLCVGCWNSHAYIYAYDSAAADHDATRTSLTQVTPPQPPHDPPTTPP